MQPRHIEASRDTLHSINEAKLLELEKRLALRKGFWRGMLTGILIVALLLGASGLYVWTHQTQVLEWATNYFLLDVAQSVLAAFPDAYMTYNHEHVWQVLDEFTNAVAANKVSRDEFKSIGREVFAALRDKRLTYEEVGNIVEQLHQVSTN